MGELRLVYMPLGEVVEAEVNPKAHDDAGISASIDRFGYVEPIVLDERTGRLISGHGRLHALHRAELAGAAPPDGITIGEAGWEVPVVRGWSSENDAEAAAALLTVNRLVEKGGWDERELLTALQGLDLTGVGFEQDDVAELRRAVRALDHQAENVESSRSERLARYTEKESRSIVLDYDAASFERVTAMAEEARREMHLRSNADVFLALLEGP